MARSGQRLETEQSSNKVQFQFIFLESDVCVPADSKPWMWSKISRYVVSPTKKRSFSF